MTLTNIGKQVNTRPCLFLRICTSVIIVPIFIYNDDQI